MPTSAYGRGPSVASRAGPSIEATGDGPFLTVFAPKKWYANQHQSTVTTDRIYLSMKRILTPWNAGVSAAKHLRWFLSYQISGETRSSR